MMTLQEAAQKHGIYGEVAVTNLDTGATKTYESIDAAAKALPGDADFEYWRGGLFFKAPPIEPPKKRSKKPKSS